MERIRTLPGAGDRPYALVIGTFDGVHRGHRALLAQMLEHARDNGCIPAAVTFREHPMAVLRPAAVPGLLTDREERAQLLEEIGVSLLIELPFEEIAGMPAETFAARLAAIPSLEYLAVGFNFRFGNGAAGDTELLTRTGREHGFAVHIEPPFRVDGEIVSSTVIRGLVEAGEMEKAAERLGRPFGYSGLTSRGKQLGRTIGFPTLNLIEDGMKAAPPSGVYASYAVLDGKAYPAMTNIGRNPTVENTNTRRIETHVLADGIAVPYGTPIRVELLHHTRPERKFPSVEALTAQLADDRKAIGEMFREGRFGA